MGPIYTQTHQLLSPDQPTNNARKIASQGDCGVREALRLVQDQVETLGLQPVICGPTLATKARHQLDSAWPLHFPNYPPSLHTSFRFTFHQSRTLSPFKVFARGDCVEQHGSRSRSNELPRTSWRCAFSNKDSWRQVVFVQCNQAVLMQFVDAYVEDSDISIPKPLMKGHRNFAALGLFATSIYSTIFSGLFMVIAIVKPRYGFTISDRGSFSPSSAALLTAFLAKTIELTFMMSFLAFLGQILSRRAMRQQGIYLVNVAMRSWILQVSRILIADCCSYYQVNQEPSSHSGLASAQLDLAHWYSFP
jgi:hypothetical protein